MWNIFEYPWTGIVIALAVQIILTILHIIKPQTRKLWHTAIPIMIIALAFGIDYLVKTDREQLNALINEALASTAAEDLPRIENLFAENYNDGYHPSKQAMIATCQKWFSTPLIEKNSLLSKQLELRDSDAVAVLVVVTQVDPKHQIAENFKVIQTTSKVRFAKQNKKWLITSAEILMINNQPIHWGQF